MQGGIPLPAFRGYERERVDQPPRAFGYVFKMYDEVGGLVPVPASERDLVCVYPTTRRGTCASTPAPALVRPRDLEIVHGKGQWTRVLTARNK